MTRLSGGTEGLIGLREESESIMGDGGRHDWLHTL